MRAILLLALTSLTVSAHASDMMEHNRQFIRSITMMVRSILC